jgi:hypothetical protein
MKRIIRLTERDLSRIVKRVIMEQSSDKELTLDIGTDIIGNSKSGQYTKNSREFVLQTDNNTYNFTYENFPGKKELFRLIPRTDATHMGKWTRVGNNITVKLEYIPYPQIRD